MKTYENRRKTEFPMILIKFDEIIFNFQEYHVVPQGYMIKMISNTYYNMNIIYIS